jgi:RecB family endonuclease NucS
MLEKDIENLIAQYPDEFFPNSGFKLIGQQVKLDRCFADIIFEDKHQRKIIVEVKRGILSRDASGQVMEYYGLLKSQSPTDTIELILCANVIPQEMKIFLQTVGIEYKEVGMD